MRISDTHQQALSAEGVDDVVHSGEQVLLIDQCELIIHALGCGENSTASILKVENPPVAPAHSDQSSCFRRDNRQIIVMCPTVSQRAVVLRLTVVGTREKKLKSGMKTGNFGTEIRDLCRYIAAGDIDRVSGEILTVRRAIAFFRPVSQIGIRAGFCIRLVINGDRVVGR